MKKYKCCDCGRIGKNKDKCDCGSECLELMPEEWEEHWKDMPEYNNIKQPDPFITATFKFKNQEDFEEFKALVKEKIYNGAKMFDGMQTKTKKQAWFPLKEKASRYQYE